MFFFRGERAGSAAFLAGMTLAAMVAAPNPGNAGQTTPATAPAPNAPVLQRGGGFVPGQNRPPGDPVRIARGKTLFEINCRGCHGPDLRGGDLGGPNLLRSQLALSDRDGELIVPVIHGSRKEMGMPAIGISDDDAKAVAAYVRSVIAEIGRQGRPPNAGQPVLNIIVGNAAEGQVYFTQKCAGCHSTTGDLQGLATRIPDPKTLQTTWVSGRPRVQGYGRRRQSSARTVLATVTLPSGESVNGQILQIDDFLISVQLPDGAVRSFRRDGDWPKVAVQDPMKRHRELLAEYTDNAIHNVTAYLVTLK
jgi:cytochrome c oxidase cbb3-type subunit III